MRVIEDEAACKPEDVTDSALLITEHLSKITIATATANHCNQHLLLVNKLH